MADNPGNIVGSLAAARPSPPQGGRWAMTIAAVLILAGTFLTWIASNRRARAESISDLTGALSGRSSYVSPEVAQWVTWGYVGVGVIVFGALLLLLGVGLRAFGR